MITASGRGSPEATPRVNGSEGSSGTGTVVVVVVGDTVVVDVVVVVEVDDDDVDDPAVSPSSPLHAATTTPAVAARKPRLLRPSPGRSMNADVRKTT
jgi:hypothetical protein